MASINAIQTQDVPAFLAALEEKYGQNWIQKNFALMAVACEEGAAGMFRTMGNGNNANLMKIAHAVLRSLAFIIHEQDPKIEQLQAVRSVMNTIWIHINSDLGREGVPESIFKAMMEPEEEKKDPSVPPTDAPQI